MGTKEQSIIELEIIISQLLVGTYIIKATPSEEIVSSIATSDINTRGTRPGGFRLISKRKDLATYTPRRPTTVVLLLLLLLLLRGSLCRRSVDLARES